MADNILLKFSADTSGLDQANESYLLLQDRERELLVELKKLDLEYDRQVETIKRKATTQEAMDKKLVGAYADKLIKEKSYRNELDKTRRGLTDFEKSFRQMDNTIATGAVSTKLTRTLRDIREELSRMEMAGDTNSQKFIDLSVKAAQYEDQIGDTRAQIRALASDTRNLDAAMSLGQGLAGSFTVAQSAAALLGGENETLQKSFFATQAVIQLFNGVQMVANTLNKDSVASVILKNALSKKTVAGKTAETTATVANTAATATETGVVKTATAAQIKWNLSILANPVMWIIAGVMLLIGAITSLVSSFKSAAESQIALNEAEEKHLTLLQKISEEHNRQSEERVKTGDHELAMAKAQGESFEKLAAAERKLRQERLNAANEQAGFYGEEIANIDANKAKVEELRTALATVTKEKEKQAIEGQITNLEAKIKIGIDAQSAQIAAKRALELFDEEQKKSIKERAKTSAEASIEAQVIAARKGSQEELAAQIELLARKKRNALDSETLTQGERKRIIAQAEADLNKLRENYTKANLNNEKQVLDARLLSAQKGSAQEFDLKAKILQKEKEIALTNSELSTEERYYIEQKYLDDLVKLYSGYDRGKLEGEKTTLEAHLLSAQEGSDQEYAIRRAMLDKQREIDLSVTTLTAADRLLIEEKYAADVKALNKKKAEDRADQAKTELLNEKTANLQILASAISTGDQRAAARKWLKDYDKLLLDQEYQSLKDMHKKGLISEKEYQKELARIRGEQAQIELDEHQAKEQAKRDITQQSIQLLTDIGNAYADAKKTRLQQELDDLDEYYTTDADEARKNADKQYITEGELKKKKLKIKRDLAKADKEQALFNIAINTAQGIMSALAMFPPNPVLAGIIGAIGLVQAAAVLAKPLPKYWKGRKAGKGELATVGEQGPELMWIPDGAAVIPSHKSRQISEAFSALDYYGIPSPRIPASAVPAGNGSGFDYERMGRAVARHVSGSTLNINLDEHGFTKYLETGRSKQQIMNSLFSSRL